MSQKLEYRSTADRPAAKLWLFDDDNNLIDFSGYTFTFKVGEVGSSALLTKTNGIVGAAGAGEEPDGTPNVVVTWAAGELDITPGLYQWQLTATTSGLDRLFWGPFTVLDVIG